MIFLNALLFVGSILHSEPTLSVQTRAVRAGEIMLVVAEGNSEKKPPIAEFNGKSLSFFPSASTGTWLAFVGLDLDVTTGPAILSALLFDAGGRELAKSESLTILPGNFPVEELKVEQKYVTPDKNDAERAESERQKLQHLFAHGEQKRLFAGRFDPPISGVATARFGYRRVFNGQPRAPHSGMDLRARKGVKVRAAGSGRVVLADPLYFSGNTIVIDHGLGLTTLYAHLSKMLVKPGDMVRKGQLIGNVGSTGRVTGPHLHWGLKYHDARIDPYSLTSLDLDALLKPRELNALHKSSVCDRNDLPPPSKWGVAHLGLRTRIRPIQNIYAPGDPVTFLVEIQNVAKKNAFIDFVRDVDVRNSVLGFNQEPQPLVSTTTVLVTEQIKIPPQKILCFEQDRDARGSLLAGQATSYTLIYQTDYLYASTSTARAGIWRGKVVSSAAKVTISSMTDTPFIGE